MNIKQQAIKGIFWSGIQNWGSQAGSLIIFLVLARLLSPADFGLVALANTFLAFFNIFIEQGFSLAIIQRQTIEVEHLNTAFWTQICLGLLLTILGFFSANLIAIAFEQPSLTPVLQWFSLLFLISSLNVVQLAILKRKLAFKKIALRALLGIFISGIVGISLALSGLGVWSLVGQQLTFEIAGVIVFWSISDWRPSLQFSLAHFKEMSTFGISIFASKILIFFNKNTDNLLIAYFLGEVALGYYAVAYRVLQVLTQLLVNTGNQVTLPVLSRLQVEPERFLKVFYQIIKFASLVSLPLFCGVIILAQQLVIVIFGEQWQTSIPIVQILSCGSIIYLILFLNRSALLAMGKPSWRLYLEAVNVSFNTIACLIAIQYGIVAVAFAYIISDFLVIPTSLWALKKLINISLKDYFKQISLPIICAMIMLGIIWLIKLLLATSLNSLTILVICTPIGTVSYTLALKFLAPSLFQESWEIASLGLLNHKNKQKNY
ncbi:MAG: lipopolysaccharide biosynthesis protein [Cyanobacteria bacterium P01_A01_bin.40]